MTIYIFGQQIQYGYFFYIYDDGAALLRYYGNVNSWSPHVSALGCLETTCRYVHGALAHPASEQGWAFRRDAPDLAWPEGVVRWEVSRVVSESLGGR